MKKFLLMAILLSTLSCSGQDEIFPDKTTMKLLKTIDNAVYCAIDPLSTDMGKGSVCGFAKYTLDSIVLEKKDIDALMTIVEDNLKHAKVGQGAYSTFMPNHAFLFVNKKDTIYLLVDLHCDKWQFHIGNKTHIGHFDAVHDKMDDFIKKFDTDTSDSEEHNITIDMLSNKLEDADCNTLPAQIIENLTKVQSCEWYILDPWDSTSVDNTFGDVRILQQSKQKSNLDSVVTIFSDTCSFVKTDIVKNCIFLPDIGIRLATSANENIDIIFSFSCNECVILLGNISFQSDCERIRNRVLTLAQKQFPQDRYIRTLLNKKKF